MGMQLGKTRCDNEREKVELIDYSRIATNMVGPHMEDYTLDLDWGGEAMHVVVISYG